PNSYWFALAPVAPLRYWRLIEVEAGRSPIFGSLRIDERILHYLVGLSYLDRRLADLFQPLSDSASLLPSHQMIAREIVADWSWPVEDGATELPLIQLCGDEIASKRSIAAAVGSLTGHH